MRIGHHSHHHHYHNMLGQLHIADLHNQGSHHQSKIQANIHLNHHSQLLHHQHIHLELSNLLDMNNNLHHHYSCHHHIPQDHLLDSYIQNNPNYNLLLG